MLRIRDILLISLAQSDLGAREAEAAVREAFAAADADGDGQLSLDEFAAFCEARGSGGGPPRPDLLASLGPAAEGAPTLGSLTDRDPTTGKPLQLWQPALAISCVWQCWAGC